MYVYQHIFDFYINSAMRAEYNNFKTTNVAYVLFWKTTHKTSRFAFV